MEQTEWTQVLLPLLTLALTFEREGQYSLAKLARATVDALGRRAAFENERPLGKDDLVAALDRVTDVLSEMQLDQDLIFALRQGTEALSESRLALIHQTPHPYVCRTCGHIAMGEVTKKCPNCGAWPETFQWFPPIYWLDALDPPTAVERLRQMPEEVAVLIEGLSEEDMARQPQGEGWCIRNILTHLRDAQEVLIFRLDLFQKAEHPVLESKAIFEWATHEGDHPPSTLDIFEMYRVARVRLLASLEALHLANWRRSGFHEEFGTVLLKQQVSYFASHEYTHLPQIEALRNLANA